MRERTVSREVDISDIELQTDAGSRSASFPPWIWCRNFVYVHTDQMKLHSLVCWKTSWHSCRCFFTCATHKNALEGPGFNAVADQCIYLVFSNMCSSLSAVTSIKLETKRFKKQNTVDVRINYRDKEGQSWNVNMLVWLFLQQRQRRGTLALATKEVWLPQLRTEDFFLSDSECLNSSSIPQLAFLKMVQQLLLFQSVYVSEPGASRPLAFWEKPYSESRTPLTQAVTLYIIPLETPPAYG